MANSIDTDAYASGGLADQRFYADGEVFDVESRSLVVMIRRGG